MRILWVSNAPWANTGYGVQTRLFVPRLRSLGHEVAVSAFYGLQGGMFEWEGIRCYPGGAQPYALDVIASHARHWQAEVVITLVDAWVLDPERLGAPEIAWAPWFPVDAEPMPRAVLEKVDHAFAPIVFSRFGQRMAEEVGLRAAYVPHGVDTEVYAPGPRDDAREALGFPRDAFVVGMVAINQGWPSRKALPQALQAFAELAARREDALLYLHTQPVHPTLDLLALVRELGLDEKVLFVDPLDQSLGIAPAHMARIFRALDCLLAPSLGEGFGVPILEAQACGCPVVVGDWTAMAEICFAGHRIPRDRSEPFWTPLGGFQRLAHVAAIREGLEVLYDQRHHQGLRERARAGALAYDADRIARDHWGPVLAEIEERVRSARRMRNAPAVPRRSGDPGVTVLVPSYLEPGLALEASRNSIADDECLRAVIVDDGSPPKTWKGVQLPERVRLVRRARRGGFARCVNAGLAAIPEGDVVLLNSDVRLRSGWLERVRETARPDPVALVGIRLVDAEGRLRHAGGVPSGWLYGNLGAGSPCTPPVTGVYGCPYVTAAFWYWKRSALAALGGLDEDFFMGLEDVDYCLRAWRAGRSVLYDGRAVGLHDEGATRRRAGMIPGLARPADARAFYRKHWPQVRLEWPPGQPAWEDAPPEPEPENPAPGVEIPPPHTLRGRIKGWLARHAGLLRGPVLEVGAWRPVEATWMRLRDLRPDLEWLGVDLRPGPEVDLVADAAALPFAEGEFGSAVCSEVLEHVFDPRALLEEIARLLRPGGVLLLTTLFAFPYHAHPNDYWRFTTSCLERLLREAGFRSVTTAAAGRIEMVYDDHGEGASPHAMPVHSFARAVR